MILSRVLAACVLAGVVSLGIFVAVSPWSDVPSGEQNSVADHGFERLLETAENLGYSTSRIMSTPLLLRNDNTVDPESTVIVVAGADRVPPAEEAAFLKSFVEAGGRLLVAEESGHAGLITTPYGVTFERAPVVSAEGATPVSYRIATANYNLHATMPTPLLVSSGSHAKILAWTPESSFADRDGDGEFGRSDPLGPFAVAAEVPVGDKGGRVLVLGSLDILSDARADAEGAAEWRRDLLADLAGPGGTIILDESHQSKEGGVVRAMSGVVRFTSETPARWLVLGSLLTAATALAVLGGRRFVRWGRHQHAPGRYRRREDVLASSGVAVPGGEHPEANAAPTVQWTQTAAFLASFSALGLAFGLHLRNPEAIAAAIASLGLLAATLVAKNPGLQLARNVTPTKVAEGQPVRVELELTASRPAALELRDLVPPEDRLVDGTNYRSGTLGSSKSVTFSYRASPENRGPHRIGPLRARTADPFGLRVQETPVGESATIFATPRREPMNAVAVPVRRPHVLLGPHAVNRAGEGTEFHAIREYQTGDPMRTVNWRASARSKDMMVTQRVLDSQTEVTVVLDARAIAEAGRSGRTPLTMGARAASTLADAASKSRDRVRLVTYGDETRELEPAPRSEFLPAMDDVLSRLAAAGTQSFEEVAQELVPSLRKGRPVILLSALEGDETVEAGARLLAGHGVLLTVVTHPASVENEAEADARRIEEERRETIRRLRKAGAVVYEVRDGTPLEDVFRFGGTT